MGGGFLLNSLDQSSLLTMGSITVSLSWDAEGACSLVDGSWGLVWGGVSSGWLEDGMLRLEGDSGRSLGVSSEICVGDGLEGLLFGLKKPLRVFCPGADGAGSCVAVDFVRFMDAVGAD